MILSDVNWVDPPAKPSCDASTGHYFQKINGTWVCTSCGTTK
jgi:rubredoxin